MSLIITSNRLTENGKAFQRGQIGTEDPANYKNFFRSPIEIEPDSEIAVVSTKIERSGNISLNENSYFCHYFGNGEEIAPGDEYPYLTSISRNIGLKEGTYNLESFPTHIQQRMRAQYAHPAIFGAETVKTKTNSSTGGAEGLDIKFTSQPSASANDVKANIVGTPVFNINSPSNGSTTNASSFQGSYTPATGVVERSGTDATSFDNASCVIMLKNRPFGLSQGKLDVDTTNATNRFAIGLSRPQIQYHANSNSQAAAFSAAGGVAEKIIYDLDFRTTNKSNHDRFIIDEDGNRDVEGPYEMYDYCVMMTEADELLVVERAYDESTGLSIHQELDYWNVAGGVGGAGRMTRAIFNGKYDGFRFEGVGDEIELYFKDKGKTTFTPAVSSDLENKPGRSFMPVGDTSYALYPMFNLGDGSVEVLKYCSGYSADTYKFPTYLTGASAGGDNTQLYTPGSDMFSNQAPVIRPGEPSPETWAVVPLGPVIQSSYSVADLNNGRSLVSGDVVSKIDRSLVKVRWTDEEAQIFASYSYVGVIGGANHAVNYIHYLTMDVFSEPNPYDTLMTGQKFPNISAKLGYPNRALALQDSGDAYVIGDNTREVTFRSPAPCERVNKSAFIRIPGLTHKSYNGNQSSISKIIYQVPQFTNDGRQFGPLFFDAPEKTYVAIKNTSTILLNHIEVQFVEADEKVIDNFTGSTQVVFHIRKRRS